MKNRKVFLVHVFIFHFLQFSLRFLYFIGEIEFDTETARYKHSILTLYVNFQTSGPSTSKTKNYNIKLNMQLQNYINNACSLAKHQNDKISNNVAAKVRCC